MIVKTTGSITSLIKVLYLKKKKSAATIVVRSDKTRKFALRIRTAGKTKSSSALTVVRN
jgi:hypothetical protein